MTYIPNNNYTEAKRMAQANADYFGRPYVIFTDTSGNTHVERLSSFSEEPKEPCKIIYPSRQMKEVSDG